MPFARPTLAELVTRVRGDLRSKLEVSGSLLRRAMIDVIAAVMAGVAHALYGYLAWLARQLFASTAEREALIAAAAAYGITPVPAAFAAGNITATGTNGSVIPAGTIYRYDAATSYRVTTGQTIASGTATVPVTAVLAGAAANLPAGTAVSLESPIAGVVSAAVTATGGLAGGVEEETTEALRARYRLRLSAPPEGGAISDYKAWVLRVPGVTRVWVYEHELGLGTVVVRFASDNPTTGAVTIPDAGTVALAQAQLNLERPTCAHPTAAAPISVSVPFTISITPDTADTRAAVTAELVDLFRRDAEPGDGAGRGKVLLSQIRTSIGVAEGVTDFALTTPSADVVPGLGQLPIVGTITWV